MTLLVLWIWNATLGLKVVSPVAALADQIEKIGLVAQELAVEYSYASLPLCIIDAVFSIGVRYTSTQRVVEHFCESTGWPRFEKSRYDRGSGTNSVTELMAIFDQLDVDEMAQSVFRNRQRTSSKSGILKSEAVYLYCQAMNIAGIDTFSDLNTERRELAEAMILGLPGQSSGIAFDYCMMLAGDDNLVKPDRMVQRFVGSALSTPMAPEPRQAAKLLQLAVKELARRGKSWTPLKLDYAIWKYERGDATC